jgi:endonuclease/exonuclease/phosphatase family metal-dependent hydrolase
VNEPNAPPDIVVATYNVEALFDCKKDAEKLDDEYLPTGHYAWTEEKLSAKIANLARVIRAINGGRGPDILALNEVENAEVLARLHQDALHDLGYMTVVHIDTDDVHGLDNAVLARFPLVRTPRVHSMTRSYVEAARRPRGVLEVNLDIHGVELTLFVNHWPAGTGRAAAQRVDVASQLRALLEERLRQGANAEILVLGDFNATPEDEAFGKRGLRIAAADAERRDAGATLFDTATPKTPTHFTRPWPYVGPNGTWNTLDHVFVSSGLLDDEGLTWVEGSTEVVREEFMLGADGTPRSFFEAGVKPREQDLTRTGYSDHLPVVTRLRRVTKATSADDR